MTKLSFCQNDPPITILEKEQAGHSYIFWTMPIMIFSQVSNFGDQSLRGAIASPFPPITTALHIKKFMTKLSLAKKTSRVPL